MLDIIKRNIRPFRDWCTRRHPNRHIHQILIRIRKHSVLQRLIECPHRSIRKTDRRNLFTVDIEVGNCNSTPLSKTSGAAGVRAEARVEALEVEGFDARAALELGVGVEGDGA